MNPYEYLFKKLGVMLTTNVSDRKLTVNWNSVHLISSLPVFWQARQIFEHFRNYPLNWRNPFLNEFCHLLQPFPVELESKEQVDLLLVLNGLQTTDENNS